MLNDNLPINTKEEKTFQTTDNRKQQPKSGCIENVQQFVT